MLRGLSFGVTALLIVFLLLVCISLFFQKSLFQVEYSTSIYASDGSLLGARIASDGQWRFEPADSVPQKFEQCICFFEDEYFYWHPGINPFSLCRAIVQNVQ